MEDFRRKCVQAIDSMLPLINKNISLLKNGTLTHVVGSFLGTSKARLLYVKGYSSATNGLYVILIFPDVAVEGYITFLDVSLNYDLKILPPYTSSSEQYQQLRKFL